MGIESGKGVNISQQTSADSVSVVLSSDHAAVPVSGTVSTIPLDGTKATYSATGAVLCEATPQDVAILFGSNSKIIRITKITVAGHGTNINSKFSAGMAPVYLKQYVGSVPSGGTAVSPAIAKHDSTSAAAAGVVSYYTADPSGGTLAANIRIQTLMFPFVFSTDCTQIPINWKFGNGPGQALVLRNNTEAVAINCNGNGNLSGMVLTFFIEWTEE